MLKFQKILEVTRLLKKHVWWWQGWLAQLGECRSAEWEVTGSNPCWINTQGL